jgi:septum formation inhibitor MinC
MNETELQVRGIHGGVLITLPSLSWYLQRDMLISRIQTQERFFRGGRIALDVGTTDWSEERLLSLLKDLSDEGVCLWVVLSQSEITKAAAEYYGFSTALPDPSKNLPDLNKSDQKDNNFFCLNRSIEDDELYEHKGNLLVLGDVPENALVKTSGSLVIWGELQGEAQAGTDENAESFVRLLRLERGKLSLGNKQVEFTPKHKKGSAIEVFLTKDGFEIKSLKTGRFAIL